MDAMQTVFDAVGGIDGLRRLANAWHRRVMADDVVAHAFSHGFHPQHIERQPCNSLLRQGSGRRWASQRCRVTTSPARLLRVGDHDTDVSLPPIRR